MTYMFLDDRISAEREERERQGRDARTNLLERWLNKSESEGDFTYRYALQQWIHCAGRRISAERPKRLKLPWLYQKALGLVSQEVLLLANGELWSLIDGGRNRLLCKP